MQPQKTVLLADGNQDFLLALSRQCEELGVKVETAADGLEALMVAAREVPDLIALDLDLPGADGLQVCEKLSKTASTSGIPIVILTGNPDEKTLQCCRDLGIHYVQKDAGYWDSLKSIIGYHLDIAQVPDAQMDHKEETVGTVSAGSSVPKVLVIDDDPHITQALEIRLGSLGLDVVRAPSATGGTYLAWTECPDLIITDQNMPEMSGEDLIVKLRGDEETKNIPVVMITGQTVDGHEDFGLKREILGRRGAAAYLTKPLDFDKLVEVLGQYIRLPSLPSRSPKAATR